MIEGIFWRLEAFVREGQRVGADGQVYEVVAAVRVGLLGARELCLIADDRDHGIRQNAASLVRDCARDTAQGLLSLQPVE